MKAKKIINKLSVILAITIVSVLMTTATVNAAAGSRIAKDSFPQYSIFGFLVYTMGVEGNYHSNGTKIDTYSTTYARTSTNGTWSVHNKSSSWTYKGVVYGTCRAYATFKNGLDTTWVSLSWQTQDESISAYAYK
ncbi:MAG: hypothetical protein PHQ32_02910 [Firmicutes bacterium]|nr:hypothetical protein [Bacillota bacterium]